MVVDVQLAMLQGSELLNDATAAYETIERLANLTRQRGFELLAFGLGGEEIRAVIETDGEGSLDGMMHGFKIGTSRRLQAGGARVIWSDHVVREPARDLVASIAWAHGVFVGDPLATPWTSHRDLMGYRHADFFHPAAVRARIDIAALHRACGGQPLPAVTATIGNRPLSELLRVAASVLGRLPAARETFRLFVHLARTCGYKAEELAQALCLTVRRVRQLFQADEPMLSSALAHLEDARLAVIP